MHPILHSLQRTIPHTALSCCYKTLVSHDVNESVCLLVRFTVCRLCCWVEEVLVVGFTCSDFPDPKEEVSSILPLSFSRLMAAAAALIFFSFKRKAVISSTIDCSSIGENRGSSAQNSTECAQPVRNQKQPNVQV